VSALTPIEWTDRVWNPLRGCARVSEGFRNCYAERVAWRFGSKPGTPYHGLVQMTSQGPKWTGKLQLVHTALNEPGFWKKPSRVFVNSMSDLFHEAVPDEFIEKVFVVIARHPQHTFQVLTKRPQRMHDIMVRWQSRGWMRAQDYGMPANVWLGVSVEDQAAADERIPLLLTTPAAVRWVSAEPLLGPVDFTNITAARPRGVEQWDALRRQYDDEIGGGGPRVDWVVVGGESGPGARPMHPGWARSLRDQCEAAGVPFFFKQWGEWLPVELPSDEECYTEDGSERALEGRIRVQRVGYQDMARVGKKAAGRLLDGVEHNRFPEARNG